MQWIHAFDLFLFDFDGLLVNSEKLHYYAYQKMVESRGFTLEWDFSAYCSFAHRSSFLLAEAIYKALPGLFDQEPHWEVLYEEKKKIYATLLKEGKVELMPGVEKLLFALAENKLERCVVTHSTKAQTEAIRCHLSILETIPHWIVREDYNFPKPDPECYHKAIALLGKKKDRIIGFEDSLRGFLALSQTEALPLLICPFSLLPKEEAHLLRPRHFESFEALENLSSL